MEDKYDQNTFLCNILNDLIEIYFIEKYEIQNNHFRLSGFVLLLGQGIT